MKTRPIIALLLVMAISLLAIGSVPAGARSKVASANPVDEPRLTPAEEHEARELALTFRASVQATNDFRQIIDELFVQDFSERLQQSPKNWLPWIFLGERLIAEASSATELRRYYAAAMSSYGLILKLHEAAESLKSQAEEAEGKLKIEDYLTLEIIAVLLSDPVIAALAHEFKRDEENEPAQENDHDQPAESVDPPPPAGAAAQADAADPTETSKIRIIKSLSQLKNVSSTLEKANELMLRRLESLALIATAAPESDAAESESQEDSPRPHLASKDENYFGYPKGTPMIHVDALPYCLYLIRVDGQLKILAAAIYVD